VGVLSASFHASMLNQAAVTGGMDNLAAIGRSGAVNNKFKLFISSSDTTFGGNDNVAGIKVFTASLDPKDTDYIRNILNTDPLRFEEEKHLLYAAFDVEAALAQPFRYLASDLNPTASVGMLSGSANSSANNPAGQNYANSYGRFDTRYQSPQTTKFISQPFGKKEYDLFHFETIDDGAVASGKYKISIRNVRGSTDERDPYGTFTVCVRAYDDTDGDPEILEEFVNCDLNPRSQRFIGKMIGDRKVTFNFDAEQEDERRLVVEGIYPNMSRIVRVVLTDQIEKGEVPESALPFGFRGFPALKTRNNVGFVSPNFDARLALHDATGDVAKNFSSIAQLYATRNLTGSILPPVPYRFKVTNGAIGDGNLPFVGQPGTLEKANASLYWGVQTHYIPATSSLHADGISDASLKPNAAARKADINKGLKDMMKFMGISKMDNLFTSSNTADAFNNNKFSLSRVALGVQAGGSATGAYKDTELSGTVPEIMRAAAYIRNGKPEGSSYTINDTLKANRITFGTLIAQTSSVTFNRFSDYMKFTNVFYGGFDGVNILDKNANRLNDKFTSKASGGGASSAFVSPGMASNMNGVGSNNNGVASYKAAINIMTDPSVVRTNILAIPGIREPFVTDHAMKQNKDYGMSIYLMDIPEFDDDNNRLFDDSTNDPSVTKTVQQFERRLVDNNSTATYFPDVVLTDDSSGQNVEVPASVAALAALGFNDNVSFPWFAPAGFNRGALDFVSNAEVRLTSGDRDELYDARINPIASFPGSSTGGRPSFVIFGQKTLQKAKSALDRVNVRRLLLEVKRSVVQVANNLVFEQNTPALRARFVSEVAPLLAIVQAQSGIEKFKIVCDDSNNTQADVEGNRLNGKIVIVPTRTIEFISLDFVITNAGVDFV